MKKNKKIRFSIITPMYNSSHLMKRYLESMLSQTCKDFELIIVDDCSTDDSFVKIKQISKETGLNMQLLKTDKNLGPGNARNLGLNNASGEFILFVDSDDYVASDMIEKLNRVVEKNDMVIFNCYRTNGEHKRLYKTINADVPIKDKSDIIFGCTTAVWGKAIRKSIIEKNHIMFPEYMRFEDWVFLVKSIMHSDKILIIDEALYYYYDNPKSIVHTSSIKGYLYSQKAFGDLENYLKKYSEDLTEAIYIREVLYVAVKDLILSCSKKEFWQEVDKIQLKYPKWYKNLLIKRFSMPQQIVLKLVRYKQFNIIRIIAKILSYI